MSAARLTSHLSQLLSEFDALERVLGAEAQCLVQRDIDALEHVTDEKTAICARIQSLEAAIGTEPIASQIAQLHPDEQPQLYATRETLRATAARCHHQNSVNGKVVHRSQQSTAALLRTMMGTDAASLYSKAGRQPRTSTSPSAIARA